MTSGDTHDRTVALLEKNNNFGMAPNQITLMKQEKVASLTSNQVIYSVGPPLKWACLDTIMFVGTSRKR